MLSLHPSGRFRKVSSSKFSIHFLSLPCSAPRSQQDSTLAPETVCSKSCNPLLRNIIMCHSAALCCRLNDLLSHHVGSLSPLHVSTPNMESACLHREDSCQGLTLYKSRESEYGTGYTVTQNYVYVAESAIRDGNENNRRVKKSRKRRIKEEKKNSTQQSATKGFY